MAGLWLFFLSVMIPLLVWVAWLAHDVWETSAEPRREKQRLAEIVALRQHYVGRGADDASGYELLGDALRVAGHTQEAQDAFEKALALGSGSSGLDVKLRLTRLELAQSANPSGFGLTLTTREIVCPRCGRLSPSKATECVHCNASLPLDTLRDVWNHGPLRALVLSDARAAMLQALVICIAIGCALAMPDPAMTAAVILAAVGVALFLFLRRLGNPD